MNKTYAIHAGHAPDGSGGACGAVGLIKESTEARNVLNYVITYLRKDGNTVYDCTCNGSYGQQEILDRIIDKSNAHDVDFVISIHFNDGSNKKKDGKITGSEVYVLSLSGSQEKILIAKRILKALEELGFKQHGEGLKTANFRVLKETDAPAMLIEVCFVSDPEDVALYKAVGAKKIGRTIAEAIVGHSINDKVAEVGSRISVKQKIKIRSSSKSDYVKLGYLLPGATVPVLEVNKDKTRARFADGMWITTGKDYVDVI